MFTSETKYVVFDGHNGEQIFVFPKIIQHSVMADMVEENSFGGLHRVSGGFVLNGECVGRSESMRLDSRPEVDTELLQTYFTHLLKPTADLSADLSVLEVRIMANEEYMKSVKPCKLTFAGTSSNQAKRLRKKRNR